jgi:hypothetical protein
VPHIHPPPDAALAASAAALASRSRRRKGMWPPLRIGFYSQNVHSFITLVVKIAASSSKYVRSGRKFKIKV